MSQVARPDFQVARLQRQAPALGHRVAGIGDQVQDRSFKLSGIDLDPGQVGIEDQLQLRGIAKDVAHAVLEVADQVVELDELGL